MGIIKKVGEVISDVGERLDRAGASVMSGAGYRSRTHALRSRIDSLPVPRVSGKKKARAKTSAYKRRQTREVSSRHSETEPTTNEKPSINPNIGEITFRET